MSECECLPTWLQINYKIKTIEAELDKTIKKSFQVSLNEFTVLYYLYEEPNQCMRICDLQERVGLTQSAMSRLVVRLENSDLEYICRKNCSEDKRGVFIILTDKGRQIVSDNIHLVKKIIHQFDPFLSQFKQVL